MVFDATRGVLRVQYDRRYGLIKITAFFLWSLELVGFSSGVCFYILKFEIKMCLADRFSKWNEVVRSGFSRWSFNILAFIETFDFWQEIHLECECWICVFGNRRCQKFAIFECRNLTGCSTVFFWVSRFGWREFWLSNSANLRGLLEMDRYTMHLINMQDKLKPYKRHDHVRFPNHR